MSAFAVWTWIAVGVLIVVPVVVFVWFLRDAARLLRDLSNRPPE